MKLRFLISVGSRARAWRRDCRGSAAVELGLVASLLMLLLAAATDLGRVLYIEQGVGAAARAGAEYAAAHGYESTNINAAGAAASPGTVTIASTTYCGCAAANGIAQQTCGSSCASGGAAGAYVSVTARAALKPLFPGFWSSRVTNGVVVLGATEVTRTN